MGVILVLGVLYGLGLLASVDYNNTTGKYTVNFLWPVSVWNHFFNKEKK